MSFIDPTKLDFTSYKNALKEYLKTQDQFKDYNFEGSNMSVLLDILAYNTYMNGFYLNMIGSEMFLDTAQLRDSVVSHAKELNYTPRSRNSAVAYVDIRLSGIGQPDKITIQKGFEIVGETNTKESYYFITDQPYVVDSSTNYTAENVPIYEGVIIRENFLSTPGARFVLSSPDIDVNSIEVEIQQSQSDTTSEEWLRATSLFGLAGDAKVFFVQGTDDYKYELMFGNDIIGKALSYGNVVKVKYLQSSGEDANRISRFSSSSSVGDDAGIVSGIQIITRTASYGGAEAETTESVRFTAPRYFSTQERAVTAGDYKTLVQAAFPEAQAVIAYGGERLTLPQYGKVFVAIKPTYGLYMADNNKREVLKYIKQRSPVALDPVVVDPKYLFVQIHTRVKYDPLSTTKNDADIRDLVLTKIRSYSDDALEDFGRDLRYSKLVAAIDSADRSIISNETDVVMYSILDEIVPGVAKFETLEFDNEIDFDRSKLPQDYVPNITSTSFLTAINNVVRETWIADDGVGSLYLYTIEDGTKKTIQSNIGTVDYKTGRVAITGLVVSSIANGQIKIYAVPRFKDLEVDTNRILIVEDGDISISVEGFIE